jgi:hypothetical protein
MFGRVAAAQHVCRIPLDRVFPDRSEEKGGDALSRSSMREGEPLDQHHILALDRVSLKMLIDDNCYDLTLRSQDYRPRGARQTGREMFRPGTRVHPGKLGTTRSKLP